MLKSYQWALALVVLFYCLNLEANARVHHYGQRRLNTTHITPAQTHQPHHHQHHQHQHHHRHQGRHNNTQSGPGWQVGHQSNATKPWPVGQTNTSWTNQTHYPWQAPAYPGQQTQAIAGSHQSPYYNQTSWQSNQPWPQAGGEAQPGFAAPSFPIIPMPIPSSVWAPEQPQSPPSPALPSPVHNATLIGTSTTFNTTSSPLPVGNQQFAALSPPNAGGAAAVPPNAVIPPKSNNTGSNPYANLFN